MSKTISSWVLAFLLLLTPICAHANGENDEITDPIQVMEAQEILYEFNLKVGPIDGVIGVRTREALSQWQKRNGYSKTGELTLKVFDHLRIASVGNDYVWGALSISTNRGWGASWNEKSRREAENKALEICQRNSPTRHQCTVVAMYLPRHLIDHYDMNFWLSAIHCRNSHGIGGSIGGGKSSEAAISYVFKRLSRFKKEQCQLSTVIAIDGSHLK